MRAVLVCIAALSIVGVAQAQDAEPPQITVVGEAAINVAPDVATIDAGVSTEGRTAREASDSNNATMGKVLLALKGSGIAEKDIQTQRLSLQPQYAQRNNAANNVTGYRASNRVTIKLRDMAQIAPTIDLVVGAGANDISGVSFAVAQPSKFLDDARVQAIADARRKAEIYAKAAGVELGAAISVIEQGASSPPMFRRATAAAMAAPTPVAPGEETLRVSVTVSWAIKSPAR